MDEDAVQGGAGAAADPGSRRAALVEMRARTAATIDGLRMQITRVTAARADANTDDEHDPEGSTIAFERSQAEALRAAAMSRLTQIDLALSRVEAGTDGRCAVCGDPIPPGRLAARPFATTCIRHA